MSAETILSRLQGVVGRNAHWRAICPAHASRHRTKSLSILETQDGRVLLHCHAGCAFDDVLTAAGVSYGDLQPERLTDSSMRKLRRPWSGREVAQALEPNLVAAFLLLRKVGANAKISASERAHAAKMAEDCLALLNEITR